jgi:hypothetical protein
LKRCEEVYAIEIINISFGFQTTTNNPQNPSESTTNKLLWVKSTTLEITGSCTPPHFFSYGEYPEVIYDIKMKMPN